MKTNKTIKTKHKYKNSKKTLKYTPKDQLNLRKASSAAIKNPIIKQASDNVSNNLSTNSLDEYMTLLTTVITNNLESTKSYSPSINKKISSLTDLTHTNIFNCNTIGQLNKTYTDNVLQLNISNSNTPKCVNFNSLKAREVLLNNFLLNKKLIPSRLLVPIQKHANCWFNTMFMCFFISDKGKKFMKYYHLLMIKGKTSNDKNITPKNLGDALLLFAISIEACYNNSKVKYKSLAYNTNNIIAAIHKALPNRSGIKDIDEYGNPYLFYNDLIDYLENNKKSISMTRFEYKEVVDKLFKNKLLGNSHPHIIVVTLFDNDDNLKAQAVDYKNKPLKITYNENNYVLDSIIGRDISKNHFCCGLTINKKSYVFDGAVFSKLSKKDWRKLLNKNKNWKPNNSTLNWNFMKGYSLLFYYRI